MKAESILPKKLSLLLLVSLFSGMAAFGQTAPNDAQSTNSHAVSRDLAALDAYFARRAAGTAIKDSTEASNLGITKPNGSNALPASPEKVYTAGLKAEQGTENASEATVISLPSSGGDKEKTTSGQRR